MDIELKIVLAGAVLLMLGGAVAVLQLRRGRLFSVLSFSTAILLIEGVGGAIKALFGTTFAEFAAVDASNPLPYVPRALVFLATAFCLYIYGYVMLTVLRGRRAGRHSLATDYFAQVWTLPYRFLLAIFTLFATLVGFLQHYYRIRAAGGLNAFMQSAYQHRVGTLTESQTQTAFVVVANIIASSAVAFAVLWVIAWLRGRLSFAEKVFVVVTLVVLLVRQWSTMYRSVLFFTLLALVAAYLSERRVRLGPMLAACFALAGFFIAFNFLHLYFYFLTAGWEKPSLIRSLAVFLGPQGHVHSLSAVLQASRDGAALHGRGLVESVFFFIPRSLWTSKLDSTEYGTYAVQAYAGLPDTYQLAPTYIGELIAHFGAGGLIFSVLYGVLHATYDACGEATPPSRAALYGLIMGRALVEIGMGWSAVSVTISIVILFGCMMMCIHGGAKAIGWLISSRKASVPVTRMSPARRGTLR